MPRPPPYIIILISFFFVKTILFAIVLGTTFLDKISLPFYNPPKWPYGYDSSSSIILPHDVIVGDSYIGRIISGLVRWDSVYFLSLADRRGEYIWEQEWAFGPGWPILIQFSSTCNTKICYRC